MSSSISGPRAAKSGSESSGRPVPVSEHKVRRNVSSYRNYADVATLEARVRDLVVARKMDREIARALNADGLLSAHGRPFSGGEVHLLRKRWSIPTVKINRTEHNPRQWPDGTYSVQGAAEALSISTQTVFKWLQKGRLSGNQITKGMPWQINLSNTQIVELRTHVRAQLFRRRRHHEVVGSPKTLGHSPNARLVVTMMEVRSYSR